MEFARRSVSLRQLVARSSRRPAAVTVALGGLALLAVVVQVTEPVPDSRLPLHIDPAAFLRDVMQVWDPSEDMGHRTGSLIAYLPVAAYYAVARGLGLSALGAQQLFFFGVLAASATGMWVFFSEFWETSSQVSRSIAALLYMFNPYVLLNVGGSPAGTTVLLLPYMAVPWVAVEFIRCIRRRKFGHGLVAAAIVGVAAPGVNATVNAIAFAACGTVLLIEIARTGFQRRAVVLGAGTVGVSVLASLWWFGPLVASLRSGGTDVYFQTDPITIGASASSFREVFRLLGLWALYQGHNGVPYYPTQRYFASVPVIVASMLGALAVFGGLWRRWGDVRTSGLALLLVVAVPMAVSIHPVSEPTLTGVVYQWLFDMFPPFRSFRGNYKWVGVVVMAYCLVIPLVLLADDRRVRRVAGAVVCGFVLANAIPFVVPGMTFPPGYRLGDVPEYWRQAGKWLDGQPEGGRALFTPSQNFSVYTWGRPQGDIAPLFTRRPVITSHIAPSTSAGGRQLIGLTRDALRDPTIPYDKVLDLLDVAFVVQRNDVDWRYYGSESPIRMRQFLAGQPALELTRTFGMLDVYRVRRDPIGPVAASREVVQIVADGGLRSGLTLFQPGTVATFQKPERSNPGVATVRASPSGDATDEAGPLLALDGDPATAWAPRALSKEGQSIELGFAGREPVRSVEVLLQPGPPGMRPTRLRGSTESATQEVSVDSDGLARFRFDGSQSRFIRIAVEGATGPLGVAEVRVPGIVTTTARYGGGPERLASFHVALHPDGSGDVRREIVIPRSQRYRVTAETAAPSPQHGTAGVRPSDRVAVLEGPTSVALPFDFDEGGGVASAATEVILAPGTYVIPPAVPRRLRLRSVDVVPVDQSSARLAPVQFTRSSPSRLTVDVPANVGHLFFGESVDPLWTARHGRKALRRVGDGNGYGNLWATQRGPGPTVIAFDAGGSAYGWLALSTGALSAVTVLHLFRRRRS